MVDVLYFCNLTLRLLLSWIHFSVNRAFLPRQLWGTDIDESEQAKTEEEWTSLTEFSRKNADIATIPSEIVCLTSLEYLNLSGNQIPSIPTEIGLMTALKQLKLVNNQISSIPIEIGMMQNLEVLYLSGNNITLIPKELDNFCNKPNILCE